MTSTIETALDLRGALIEPPSDEVTALTMIARTALSPYADKDQIDVGFGFSEGCLDFHMNGKAVRVVISEVASEIIQSPL